MTRPLTLGLVALTLLGLGASAGSTYVHYQLILDPTYAAFCDLSPFLSCESAYASRFGAVGGVSVGLIGLLWFGLMALLVLPAAFAGRASAGSGAQGRDGDGEGTWASRVPAYVFTLSMPAVAVVVFYGYVSLVVLETLCLLCVGTYVAVLGLFLVSSRAQEVSPGAVARAAGRDLRTALASPRALGAGATFVVLAVAAVLLFPRDSGIAGALRTPSPAASPAEVADFEAWFTEQPRVNLVVSSTDAPVVVVKFNDYQCPSCALTHFLHQEVRDRYRRDYAGDVAFVAVDYPLHPDCNPGVTSVVHEAACAGAVAVRLAREVGTAERMADWLYANQEGVTPDDVAVAAREIGGVEDFDAQYDEVVRRVRQEAEVGRQLGVRGTPTFFINGVRIEGGLTPERLDAAIALELRRAGVLPSRQS